MKTLWNETAQVEAHISGLYSVGDALIFEANLLLDPGLAEKVLLQKKTYTIVQKYGRRQLQNEMEAVHQKLFTAPGHISFRKKIKRLFTKQ